MSDRVIKPFTRITCLQALFIPLDLHALKDADGPPRIPTDPACAEFADSNHCRRCQESWLLRLAELPCRPGSRWHRCDFGRYCAVVAVVCRDRCLGAVKLVCRDSMAVDSFQAKVELIDILVENLASSDAAERLTPDLGAPPPGTLPARRPDVPGEGQITHPRVLKALDYIEEHLSDSKLTVRRVALELGNHRDYLAHLFTEQVGRRMSRYITSRRMELAKTLLATTDWQIKRVARETGYANPNWFSHVFHAEAGLTPCAYRRQNGVERRIA